MTERAKTKLINVLKKEIAEQFGNPNNFCFALDINTSNLYKQIKGTKPISLEYILDLLDKCGTEVVINLKTKKARTYEINPSR